MAQIKGAIYVGWCPKSFSTKRVLQSSRLENGNGSRYLLEMAHADTTTYDEAGMSHIFVEVGKGGIRDMCYICVYTRTPREKSGKYVSPEERNRASTITSEWRAAYGAKKRILMHFRSRCSR